MFDTPIVNTLLHRIALALLKLTGWRMEGSLPDARKFVLIAAPHTSNWDLPVMLCLAFAFRTRLFWMGKDTLFRWPFGAIMRWLGGISIDRTRASNVVAQTTELFRKEEDLVMVVPPEGTRQKVRYWKTGFYRIAESSSVPIVLGFLDYRRKVGGIGPVVTPTGDIEADMEMIRAFYADVTGKYHDQTEDAAVTPRGR
jgi:1-acyl-sn-glycerol-3-phosphate acyltransferase